MKTSEKETFETLSFDILNEQEMNNVRGGSRPKTRDLDHYIEEEDE